MMTVFDKNQSRWAMKRAHDLAKNYFKEGTYSERFAKALKMAHAEAAKIIDDNNWLLKRFACHYRSSMGRDLHDRLMAIDVFAYNGQKPLRILGCFQIVFNRHDWESEKVWLEFGKWWLENLDMVVNDVFKMRDFYCEPRDFFDRQIFCRSENFF